LIDGLFRTTRTGGLRYPSYDRLFSGRLHPEDAEVVDELQARLQVLKDQGTTAKTRIFAPIGIGHHADHLVTHLAVKRVFETVQWWADSPYHLEYISTARRLSEMPAHQSQTRLLTPGQAKRKQAALDHYKSQLPGLYQNGLNSATLLTETWYEISST
jgi:LmbE family N-acetylglucosaminyl deacetylase